MVDLTVLINSCDKFSDMWENNLSLFKKNWNDDSQVILFTDDSSSFSKTLPELKIVKGEMSERIIKTLQEVDTKYIFLVFDDYYLINKANVSVIKDTISYMDKFGISYCGMSCNRKRGKRVKHNNLRFVQCKLEEPYEVNFYPSIWRKDDLITCLKNKKDIWDSEASLSKRLKDSNFKAVILLNKNVYPFLDVVRKGKYLRGAAKYIKKHNLYLSNRPIMTRKEAFINFVSLYSSLYLSQRLKEKIKNIGRKKGKHYYSDGIN